MKIRERVTRRIMGEVWGLEGDGEIAVVNYFEGLTQYFQTAEMALFYIETRVCRVYDLV